MLKKGMAVLAIAALLATPGLAFGQAMEKKAAEHGAAAEAGGKGSTGSSVKLGFALGFGLALAAFGGAISQSNAIAKSVDAVARQPEAGARIQGMMIIGLALIETLVIYMLLICFMWGDKIV